MRTVGYWIGYTQWAFRATYTQGNAGATDVIADITPGDVASEIKYPQGILALSATAGARTSHIIQMDQDNNQVILVVPSIAANSGSTHGIPPLAQAAAAGGNNPGMMPEWWTVTGDDKIRVSVLQMAQNELISVTLRAYIRGIKPTSASITAGVTEGVVYNRVGSVNV